MFLFTKSLLTKVFNCAQAKYEEKQFTCSTEIAK